MESYYGWSSKTVYELNHYWRAVEGRYFTLRRVCVHALEKHGDSDEAVAYVVRYVRAEAERRKAPTLTDEEISEVAAEWIRGELAERKERRQRIA